MGWKPNKGFLTTMTCAGGLLPLFSGAFGHTYGHVNLWRFNVPGKVRTRERFEMMDLTGWTCWTSPGRGRCATPDS